MIIVWRGLGLPIMLAGVVVIAVCGQLPISEKSHAVSSIFAFTLGGGAIYFLDSLRRRESGVGRDSLYWIPMRAWAFILVVGGICYAFSPVDASKGDIGAQSSSQPTTTVVVQARRNSDPVTSTSQLRLQAVFYTGSKTSTAIVNDRTVSVGETVNDLTVIDIQPQWIKLRTADGKELLVRLTSTSR